MSVTTIKISGVFILEEFKKSNELQKYLTIQTF